MYCIYCIYYIYYVVSYISYYILHLYIMRNFSNIRGVKFGKTQYQPSSFAEASSG